ncbi:YceD family protein [Insolitispirillum peregrinum]|uniref:Uncharacterized metal-binding protein YceD, DUF177 family n=1 Tax=Insolitispirillum peregrinum TaxID=80876 RepID=A0A1N7IPX2_9PROT|nr:DUF177 domain-containing protein [Insolitispirillum peregrinum]SIS39130.1 Uncharacterized metal-binding protein YceD, DUF177 family [Insolitispirillum peregrinum]
MTDPDLTGAPEAPLPFTHPYPVERLPGEGRVVKLALSTDECAAVARYLSLDGLTRLSAKLTVKPFAGGELVRVTGTVDAHVTQTCGVTLVPVESDINEEVERVFSFNSVAEEVSPGAELELEPDGAEPPEPIIDGHVDLGAVVVEQLALGIDPFPRAPGAEFTLPAAVSDPAQTSPFAVLSSLRTGKMPKS